METRRSSSSSPWERGVEFGHKLACQQLATVKNVEEQCRKSGARYIEPNEIAINYLNRPYRIMLPDARVLLEDTGVEAHLRDKILILHYFTGAKGTAATGKLIAFKQLSGGASYFPAFSRRAIGPLVKNFGKSLGLLKEAAAKLGGREASYGDVSVTINAFDRVPVTLLLWKGDEELAPNGNILFDANVSDYLPTEDVAVVCETIIWKLLKDVRST